MKPLAHQVHRRLAVAEHAGRLGVLGREIAGLERLERAELAQALASLDEGRVLEAAVLSGLRVGQRVLAADAHDEVGIVEVHRPLLARSDHNRGDSGGLDLLHRAEEVVPGLDILGLHPGLLEQFLVVIEGDQAHLERHAHGLPVDLESVDRGRNHRRLNGADIGGEVLEEAGLVLRLHHAAGPTVEQLGSGLVRLQHGRQLRLERFVLEVFELDVDPFVRGVVVGRDLVPQRLLSGIFADVKNGDVRIGEGRERSGPPDRRRRL